MTLDFGKCRVALLYNGDVGYVRPKSPLRTTIRPLQSIYYDADPNISQWPIPPSRNGHSGYALENKGHGQSRHSLYQRTHLQIQESYFRTHIYASVSLFLLCINISGLH